MFDIPVALILFRRKDSLERIIGRIREVEPQKMYLLSDAGRDEKEQKVVLEVRQTAEKLIDWPCEIIKYYAEENRGVYRNIGLGAKWVFEREERAIFLEDDNLPEVSFFSYCRTLLEKYANNPEILWICGTNYLEEYRNATNDSYMFTHNLLPCGWASWSDKFLQNYDFGFSSIHEIADIKNIRKTYLTNALYRQEFDSIKQEYLNGKERGKYRSWDYHMIYTVRSKNMLGISPAVNQIENIGVDGLAEHGGNSFSDIMTKRFCGMKSGNLEEDLTHPVRVQIDKKYERKVEHIITKPLMKRTVNAITNFLRKTFHIPSGVSTKDFFLKR